jgi:hypothetical protein
MDKEQSMAAVVRVRKAGNSLGVILSKDAAESLSVSERGACAIEEVKRPFTG